MVLITIVTGAYKPTYNWGPHIVGIYITLTNWRKQDMQGIYDSPRRCELFKIEKFFSEAIQF